MGVEANPITLTWIGGIGFSAIIAIVMLHNERAKGWSDRNIVARATVLGFSFILLILWLKDMI